MVEAVTVHITSGTKTGSLIMSHILMKTVRNIGSSMLSSAWNSKAQIAQMARAILIALALCKE
jgi:hypothetical protein